MHAWRLAMADAIFDFSGKGAAQFGGRWNYPEHPALYLGLTPATCVWDTTWMAGHLPRLPLKLMHLRLPATPELYLELTAAQLPKDWDALPADRPSMTLGSEWLAKGEHLGLIVPSATLEQVRWLMINPRHPACDRIQVLQVTDFVCGRPQRSRALQR
ncbi:RES domain-containing protein [Pseudomonas sp. RIT412]|nr:RES domain-containing protein [Pseudomonas sp. RIT 409]RAU46398.1 RES domain-containing protein [Pseudomonas sp. RIT 412]